MHDEPTTAGVLELTRRAFATSNGDDFDAMMSFLAPGCVWDVAPWGLGTHTGISATRTFIERWIGSFAEHRVVLEELLDLGGGVVFAVATQHARSAGSRVDLQLRAATVFVWVQGRVTRLTLYRDIDEGRASARRLAESIGALRTRSRLC
jgi:ketosteroid isomerase-like protein